MPILDSDQDVLQNTEDDIKAQALKEFFYASLLTANVSEVETGSTVFVNELVEMLDKENSPLNPMLQRHMGRPIYSLDCRLLHKGDAIGWLEKIVKLPKSPKPILVIENITEIPEEDANHDDPQYVRNLLMHNWKNPMNEIFNTNTHTSFKIVPADYTIFITWTPENRGKLDAIHQPSDGFAVIENLEEYLKDFKADFKDETLIDLEDAHVISYEKLDYADILSVMNNQRVVHVMHDWNVCEIEEVDTDHIADAYHQMKSIYDAWEEGDISRAYTVDMNGVELCSDGCLNDGAYFTKDGKYIIIVLKGQIISALYNNGKTTIIRIGSHEYDYADYV